MFSTEEIKKLDAMVRFLYALFEKKEENKTDVIWRGVVRPSICLSVNDSCTLHNSVTIFNIFMQFYRNMYQVRMACHV